VESFELPWANIMAASVIVRVPLIILVMIFQRALTAGAVKGRLKRLPQAIKNVSGL
jgi:multiple sugar transport system permease protein